MCRAGIRPTSRALALGIFGAGNVGAAVTKFLAPFVLVAYGWQAVAQVWAVGIAVMAIVFWFTTTDDPVLRERRARGEKPNSAWLELEPLKNIQVWRFSLYYFFVFGAFVALSLWLPRYLIGVYGLDIKTAGMAAAMLLAAGQRLPRLWRTPFGPLRRTPGDVLDLPGLRDLHLRVCRIRRPTMWCVASPARSPSTWRWA